MLKWIRRLLAALAIFFGFGGLCRVVDATPGIGSPQIDYPIFNYHWPLATNFAHFWFIGVAFAAIAALGTMCWSPPKPLSLWRPARAGRTWLIWFAVAFAAQLGEFLVYGTMGPLGVVQPIVRFAFTEALVAASIMLVVELALRIVAERFAGPGLKAGATLLRRLGAFAGILTATLITLTAIFVLLTRITGGPVGAALVYAWPLLGLLGLAVAVLFSLIPRAEYSRSPEPDLLPEREEGMSGSV